MCCFIQDCPQQRFCYELLDYISPGRKQSNGIYRATTQQWTNNEHKDGLEPGQATWREYDTVVGCTANLSQVDELFVT